MRYLLSLLLFVFPLFAYDITVNGTGLVGIWTAYSLSTELEKNGLGDGVTLHLVGEKDWQEGLKETEGQEISEFSHETSSWGPFWIQLQTGFLWNLNDDKYQTFKEMVGKVGGDYFISPDLSLEDKRVIEMYAGWHGRHLDSEEQRVATFMGVSYLARKLWHEFLDGLKEEDKKRVGLALEGCWGLRASDLSVRTTMEEFEALNYPVKGYFDTDQLAKIHPFFATEILEKELKAVFFPHDGIVDSNKLRQWLWNALLEKRGGKPAVALHLGKSVEKLLLAEDRSCKGVTFKDGSTLSSDLVVFATGYGTKAILKQEQIDLPLCRLWGAAIRAELKDKIENHFAGVVGTGPYRLALSFTEGDKVAMACPYSFFVPENTTPSPLLFKDNLNKLVFSLFKNRIDPASLHYFLAPRTLIPDELPVIDLEKAIPNVVILLPTHHLGLTQSIALGKIASLHALNKLGKAVEMPLSMEPFGATRFLNEKVENRLFHR